MMFVTEQVHPQKLVELIDCCTRKRDAMEAPAWKEYIDLVVADSTAHHGEILKITESEAPYSVSKRDNKIPFGVYLGSKVQNTFSGQIGYVVGFGKDYIFIAFEDDPSPRIINIDAEAFENELFIVV